MSDLCLLRTSLRDLLAPKKLIAAVILIAAPSLISCLWRFADPKHFNGEVAYNALTASLVFGTVLVILAVVFGTGAVSQELEQKTIVYLLTRPVPRWRILLVKFAAALIAIIVTSCLASLLLGVVTYGPARLGESKIARDALVLCVGALAYGALFLLLATLFNRPLMWGLLFAFGWESWVPTMPGKFQKVSVMTYLRVLAPHKQPQSETMELSDFLAALNPQTIERSFAWWALGGIIVVALAAAMIVFSRSEYVPREDVE